MCSREEPVLQCTSTMKGEHLNSVTKTRLLHQSLSTCKGFCTVQRLGWRELEAQKMDSTRNILPENWKIYRPTRNTTAQINWSEIIHEWKPKEQYFAIKSIQTSGSIVFIIHINQGVYYTSIAQTCIWDASSRRKGEKTKRQNYVRYVGMLLPEVIVKTWTYLLKRWTY